MGAQDSHSSTLWRWASKGKDVQDVVLAMLFVVPVL